MDRCLRAGDLAQRLGIAAVLVAVDGADGIVGVVVGVEESRNRCSASKAPKIAATTAPPTRRLVLSTPPTVPARSAGDAVEQWRGGGGMATAPPRWWQAACGGRTRLTGKRSLFDSWLLG